MEFAKKLQHTIIGDLVSHTEVDYLSGVNLIFNPSTLEERNITLSEIQETLEANKRECAPNPKTNSIMIVVEDSDVSTLYTLRNKLLSLTVAGIPGISNLTIVKEDK